jgi:hypothetical protein
LVLRKSPCFVSISSISIEEIEAVIGVLKTQGEAPLLLFSKHYAPQTKTILSEILLKI